MEVNIDEVRAGIDMHGRAIHNEDYINMFYFGDIGTRNRASSYTRTLYTGPSRSQRKCRAVMSRWPFLTHAYGSPPSTSVSHIVAS